jgi:signal transduction histidine kinase
VTTVEPTDVTIPAHNRSDLGQFAGIVADIGRTLESPHEAESRIGHVLGLARGIVPCDRCALYTRSPEGEPGLISVPALPAPERARLAEFLGDVLQFMEGDEASRRTFDSRAHLALPIIGLDEIIGVLIVDRERGEEYEPHHLRLLSAIASQLGAYVTMVRLHHETARQTALLVDRERQLRGAGRFREEFIGVVGHDLRSPLSAIRTGAQLLRKRAQLEPRDIAVVERITLSADRMSRMIDELMDFARGRLGGGIPIRRTPVDLHALCEDVVEEARTAHGRTVHVELSGNPRGQWDSDRLAQLISNLVGNAIQHSPATSAVTVIARDEQEYAVVEVRNAGAPIPAGQLEHIFEPFHRGEEAKPSTGLGLGLYIVERIVRAHGGTITVTSTRDEGTTFAVRLPRRRAGDRDGMDRRSVT